MICQRCLRAAAKRSTSSLVAQTQTSPSTRSFSHAVRQQNAAAAPPAGEDAATGSGAADVTGAAGSGKSGAAGAKAPLSSVPAGTLLKGLNFIKNKTDPVALEDSEYPAWLWKVLEKKDDGSKKMEIEGDLFAKSKKQRQRAAKALRRQALLNPDSLAPKVPLYEQSIDLPRGDGTLAGAREAGDARRELTKSMRDNRRSKIKEANFLKGMS